MTVRMEAVAPPIMDAALREVKAWLRIIMADDDGAIMALCRSAIALAEDFCGQHLFLRAGVAVVAASHHWERVRACPVWSIGAARALGADGTVSDLPPGGWAVDIDAAGDGWVRVIDPTMAGFSAGFPRMEIDIRAGMAESWEDLPGALRQGIVRLAAHLFTHPSGDTPPAIVTALWRPWRRMRLA